MAPSSPRPRGFSARYSITGAVCGQRCRLLSLGHFADNEAWAPPDLFEDSRDVLANDANQDEQNSKQQRDQPDNGGPPWYGLVREQLCPKGGEQFAKRREAGQQSQQDRQTQRNDRERRDSCPCE